MRGFASDRMPEGKVPVMKISGNVLDLFLVFADM
jgi:hypothetical protein